MVLKHCDSSGDTTPLKLLMLGMMTHLEVILQAILHNNITIAVALPGCLAKSSLLAKIKFFSFFEMMILRSTLAFNSFLLSVLLISAALRTALASPVGLKDPTRSPLRRSLRAAVADVPKVNGEDVDRVAGATAKRDAVPGDRNNAVSTTIRPITTVTSDSSKARRGEVSESAKSTASPSPVDQDERSKAASAKSRSIATKDSSRAKSGGIEGSPDPTTPEGQANPTRSPSTDGVTESAASADSGESGSGLSAAVIASISGFCAVLLIPIGICIYCVIKRDHRQTSSEDNYNVFDTDSLQSYFEPSPADIRASFNSSDIRSLGPDAYVFDSVPYKNPV